MFIQEDDLKLNDWQFSQRKYLPYKVKKTLAKYIQMDTTRRNISMIQQNRTKWQYICEIKYMSFQKSEEDE